MGRIATLKERMVSLDAELQGLIHPREELDNLRAATDPFAPDA